MEAEVGRVADGLRRLGIGVGDAVGLCMPMIPECVAHFLACARIGAVVAPLCISDGYTRRGKRLLLRATADEAARTVSTLEHSTWSGASTTPA